MKNALTLNKKRLMIAALTALVMSGATAGALTLSHKAMPKTDAVLANQIDARCDTPDSPGCAALLNQIEPGA